MKKKTVLTGAVLMLLLLLVTYCNLPQKTTPATNITTSTTAPTTIFETTPGVLFPTPIATEDVPTECKNLYQPSRVGDTWVYAGSNTALSRYERRDTISSSDNSSFTSQNTIASVSYRVDYTCTDKGLIADDPVQQYLGALLNSPGSPLKVKLNSVSGVSLPKDINPGDEWQQEADVEAEINGTKMDGWLIFDYTAVKIEEVTVPAGTYQAMRVEAVITVEATPLRIKAGTYEATIWMAPNVGIIKTKGTSHVPGIDFSDSTELTGFTASQ